MAEIYKKLTDFMPLIEDDNFGEWIIDRENDGTPEHPINFPFVSYSRMVDAFVDEVYKFEETHQEYELTKYGETLEQHDIEWGTESMSTADISSLDCKCIMALIMGAVRAERFCDGALLGFFKKGTISRWLKRLEELDLEG